jgi:hypothetical protein
MTLRDAERLYNEAPDAHLSASQIGSVVAAVMRRMTSRWEPMLGELIEDLLFTADALAASDLPHSDPPDLIGLHRLESSHVLTTDIDSYSVDTRRIVFSRLGAEVAADAGAANAMVYNVWPGFDELDRSEFRRVRQGTMRRDACLDSCELGQLQIGAVHNLWCEDTEHEGGTGW